MDADEATVGRKVRTVEAFLALPQGTVGTITEIYDREELGEKGRGFAVTWEGKQYGHITDGFSEEELQYLEVVP